MIQTFKHVFFLYFVICCKVSDTLSGIFQHQTMAVLPMCYATVSTQARGSYSAQSFMV